MSKNALITGAGSGIGFAIAGALLGRGWNVAICGRNEAKIERASARLAGASPRGNGSIHAAAVEVSDPAAVKRWVAKARERFGPPDLLVNNAGVGAWGDIGSLPDEAWDQVMAVNLKGGFLCTREVLPFMRAKGGGYIVNISSLAGKKGMAGISAYSASKFGLIGFTQCLNAEEKGNNIRATAICPGYVATPMSAGARVPAADMIQPEDIAATVLYLLDLSPKVLIQEVVIERIGA